MKAAKPMYIDSYISSYLYTLVNRINKGDSMLGLAEASTPEDQHQKNQSFLQTHINSAVTAASCSGTFKELEKLWLSK